MALTDYNTNRKDYIVKLFKQMGSGRLIDFLVDQDIFGQPISVFYKDSDVFKTRLGALATMATYALMLFNLLTLMQAFFDGSKQTDSYGSLVIDKFTAGPFNLLEQQMQIAMVFKERIPPEIGRMALAQIKPVDGKFY